jgi:hypothetical protein
VTVADYVSEPEWKKRQVCNKHTPQPESYLAWHEWAEQMARTHDQHQCGGCGLWAIWTRKRAG